LTIVSFTNNKDFCKDYLESVVDEQYLDRVEFYIDPDRKLYRAFGFNWKLDQGNEVRWKPFIMKDYAKAHKSESGKEYGGIAFPGLKYEDFVFRKYVKDDDPLQQGGNVTLDKSGNLIKIFAMDSVMDRPSFDQLLA